MCALFPCRSSVEKKSIPLAVHRGSRDAGGGGRLNRALSSASSSRRDSGARRPSNLSASGVSSSSYHSLNNEQPLEMTCVSDGSPSDIVGLLGRPASPLDTRVPTLIRIVEADEEEQQVDRDSRDGGRDGRDGRGGSREPSALRPSASRLSPVAIVVDRVAREPRELRTPREPATTRAAPHPGLNITLCSEFSASLDSSTELDAVHFHIGGTPIKPGRHHLTTTADRRCGIDYFSLCLHIRIALESNAPPIFRRTLVHHRRALSGESSASTGDEVDLHLTTEDAADGASNGRFCRFVRSRRR